MSAPPDQQSNANGSPPGAWPWPTWEAAREATEYFVDAWQRAILTWDVLRERGNQYLEHERSNKPPVLAFDYDMVLDGRTLPKPANYALVRIKPTADHPPTDPNKRPFVVIDPRAGHGPGIGGFKIDSEVGIALKQGHPCYFVMFFPQPVKGQTIESVCAAEIAFVRKVNELHPHAEGRPFLIGNCQGGWALMMLAALVPNEIGPILLAGSPLSYWAGVAGKNPMRYHGRPARGQLARLAGGRPRPRQVRRRSHRQQLREPRPREHLLDEALQPVFEGRHGAAAVPALREVVGRPLPDEQGGDGLDRPEPVRRQQAGRRRGPVVRRQAPHRPAQRPLADHRVRVVGRQHHAAAAGAGLDPRSLPQRRRHPPQRPDDRLLPAREDRPPRHLRVGGRGQARDLRAGQRARADRYAAARPVRGDHRGHASRDARPGSTSRAAT